MDTTTSADLKRFTHPAAWGGGGWHGLALRYPSPSPARLQAARDTLWAYPGLEGCWRRNDREPAAAGRLRSTYGLHATRRLYGFAHLSGTHGVACSAVAWVDHHEFDEDDEDFLHAPAPAGPTRPPTGWLNFCLPYGGLWLGYQAGRPRTASGGAPPWRDEVDGWLRGLAEHVHREVPFELALVGWPDGDLIPTSADEVPFLEFRASGYLVPTAGALAWHPPRQDPPILDLFAFG
jgi:hypothetical protein